MKAWIALSVLVCFAVQPLPAQSTNGASLSRTKVPSLSRTNDLSLSATNRIAPIRLAKDSATNSPSMVAPLPFTTDLSRTFTPENLAPFQPKPNEVRIGNVRASGIAVEAVKTARPLSLINPFKPPTNSSPEDNVVRDPFNGKVNGLTLFTVKF